MACSPEDSLALIESRQLYADALTAQSQWKKATVEFDAIMTRLAKDPIFLRPPHLLGTVQSRWRRRWRETGGIIKNVRSDLKADVTG